MSKLTVAEKRKRMNQVLNKFVSLVKNKPKTLLQGSYFNNKEGEHCIIGHYLSKADMIRINLDQGPQTNIDSVWDNIKTSDIKNLPLAFWDAIQCLNDDSGYWSPVDGFTESGLKEVEEIRRDINEKPMTFWV